MNQGIQTFISRQFVALDKCRKRLSFIRDNYADLQERRSDYSRLGHSPRKPLGRLLQLEVEKLQCRINKIEKEIENMDVFC